MVTHIFVCLPLWKEKKEKKFRTITEVKTAHGEQKYVAQLHSLHNVSNNYLKMFNSFVYYYLSEHTSGLSILQIHDL